MRRRPRSGNSAWSQRICGDSSGNASGQECPPGGGHSLMPWPRDTGHLPQDQQLAADPYPDALLEQHMRVVAQGRQLPIGMLDME